MALFDLPVPEPWVTSGMAAFEPGAS